MTHDLARLLTEVLFGIAFAGLAWFVARELGFRRRRAARTDELRLSNERLQASQREYQELVNTVDGIVWEASVGKPCYTFVSRQVERVLGYPVERWLNEPGFWRSILHHEDRERLTGDAYLDPSRKTDTQIEYRMITASGETLWMRDHIKVIFDAGQAVKMRGILIDNSEKKRNDEQLRFLQEAAVKASRVKSEFLANMSHEIRTPLNAIIGMASLGLEMPLNDEQQDCLGTIKTAADSLLALINDILDYSKIEADKLQLEYSDFNLEAVCRNALDVVGPLAKIKKIDLETQFEPGLRRNLHGDSGRVLQILLNLLSNAVKFSPEGGKVLLKANRAKSTEREIACIRFEVTDQGIGISPEVQARLFQPFIQADASTARRYGGTGLGLSICRRLSELMKGQIGVESEMGQGTTFWVEIPFQRSSPVIPTLESHMKPITLDEIREKIRILVADDNPANQKVIRRFMEKLGCQAEIVGDGAEALAAFKQKKFDLVLMDCQMPGMDGYTATQMIREFEKSNARAAKPVPIIALTAHAFADDRRRCEIAGMNDYLSKPVTLKQLSETVIQWLQPESAAGPEAPEQGPTGATAGRIDRDYLRQLEQIREGSGSKSEPDDDLIRQLVALFASSGSPKIAAILKATRELNLDAAEREAHFFKSTCNNVGAKLLARICDEIEQHARKRDEEYFKSTGPATLNRLKTEYRCALTELDTLLGEKERVRPN